jgi:hypothetical protein
MHTVTTERSLMRHRANEPAKHTHEFKLMSINPNRLWHNGLRREDVHVANYRVVSPIIRHALALRPHKQPNILRAFQNASVSYRTNLKRKI